MKMIKQILLKLALASTALIVVACGGGAGGTGSGGTGVVSPSLTISLKTITAVPVTPAVLEAGQAVRVSAVYKSASGQAISGAVVIFSLSSSDYGTMSASDGSALTDSSGLAFVDITAKSPSPTGVLTINATTQNGTTSISAVPYSIRASGSNAASSTAPNLKTQIFDSNNVVTANQAAGAVVQAKTTVLLADGTPVVGQAVTFKVGLDTYLVTMTPSSGNAITDSSGVASATFIALAPSNGGVYSVEATTTIAGTALSSGTSNIQVGAATILLGSPTLVAGTPSPLPAGNVATIQVPVTSNGIPIVSAPSSSLTISSTCAQLNPAKAISTVVGVTNGIATINYQNLGCTTSPDTLSISMIGASSPVALTIAVSAAVGSKLSYVGATPTSNVLVVKGAGGLGRVESGVVSFKLEDSFGAPVANQSVQFSLNTIAGGITLTQNVPITNAAGIASVIVNSGNLPTPLTVLAKVTNSNSTLTAASSVLSISAGPPEQRSMSLSVEKQAIEGWNIDGTTSTVTIRMADYWGNAVPDNTAVSFISEGASISNTGTSNGSCLSLNGTCSVVFRSQNFRPLNGRVSILAYTEGIEGYDDANNNGIFDSGENCFHSGAPYLDNDESGTFNSGDTIITNISPSTNAAKTPTPCTLRAATYVHAKTVIVLSSAATSVTGVFPTSPSFASCSNINFLFRVADVNGNSVPQGSTVSVTDTDKVTAGTVYSSTVLASTNPSLHQVLLKPDTVECAKTTGRGSAFFNVVVTTPSGLGVVHSFSIPY